MINKIRVTVLIALLVHHIITIVKILNVEINLQKTTAPELKPMRDYGKRFFTIWTFICQTAYICFSLINDDIIFRNNHAENWFKLHISKDVNSIFYWAFVFPWSIFVYCMFWTVYSYDPELVFPKQLHEFVSQSLNESLHTNILVLIALEIFSNFQKPPNIKLTLSLAAAYSTSYIVLFYYTYLVNNVWIYKLFSYLSFTQHVLFNLMNCSFGLIVSYIGMKFQEKKYNYSTKVKDTKLR